MTEPKAETPLNPARRGFGARLAALAIAAITCSSKQFDLEVQGDLEKSIRQTIIDR
jgi:hypothetical protein